jgi:hypothetical protein
MITVHSMQKYVCWRFRAQQVTCMSSQMFQDGTKGLHVEGFLQWFFSGRGLIGFAVHGIVRNFYTIRFKGTLGGTMLYLNSNMYILRTKIKPFIH